MPLERLRWRNGPVAQRLEQRTHNSWVGGSNPPGPFRSLTAATDGGTIAPERRRGRLRLSIGTTARIFEQALGWSPDEAIRGGPRTRPAALAAAHDAALAAAAHPQVSRLRQDLELRLDAPVAAG